MGLRKIFGGEKKLLMWQFMGESFFTVLIAGFICMARPYFEQFVESPITFTYLYDIRWIIYLVAAWLLLSFLAGIYPALIITSYEPSLVLKGSFKKSRTGTVARKTLVIFQFIISTSLITGTLIIHKQIRYLNQTELGFDKEHTLAISMSRIPDQHILSALKKNFLQHSNIQAVSFSSAYPSRNSGGQLMRGENMADDEHILVWEWRVDEDVLDAFGLRLESGRTFQEKNQESVEKEYIINQTAMRQLGWDEENAIGMTLILNDAPGRCIGVLADFHFASLKEQVEPLILNINSNYRNNVIVRLGDGDLRSTMEFLEGEWKKHNPGAIFDYRFIEESFDRLYKNESRTARMFSGFSLLAIVIASLGLFGLSTYETQMRTKEIGIRKAMGSSDAGIFRLLMTKFTYLILFAFIVSVPVAYMLMEGWLESFAYRISLGLGEFVMAGMISLVVVLVSVGYRSLKAAIQNPARSLRYE